MSVPSLTRLQRCYSCNCTRPATSEFFCRDSKAKNGLRRQCRTCKRLENATYHRNNRESRAERNRRYEQENPEAARARKKRYHERNAPALILKARAWYEENRAFAVSRSGQWQKANPERRRAYRLNREAVEGRCRPADILQMYEDQQRRCAYCETPLLGSYHVDHMLPLSRGGTGYWHNLAVVCPQCNLRKHAKTVEEFFDGRPML